jgi:hypothetical protein
LFASRRSLDTPSLSKVRLPKPPVGVERRTRTNSAVRARAPIADLSRAQSGTSPQDASHRTSEKVTRRRPFSSVKLRWAFSSRLLTSRLGFDKLYLNATYQTKSKRRRSPTLYLPISLGSSSWWVFKQRKKAGKTGEKITADVVINHTGFKNRLPGNRSVRQHAREDL